MDDFPSNTCLISIQPKQNFHFRYVSELRSTHGVIIGQQEQQQQQQQQQPQYNQAISENIYPTIKLKLPANGHLDEFGNKRNFYVLCSLHSYGAPHAGPNSLSPYLLMPKRGTRVNYNFIFSKMDEHPTDQLEQSFVLKDYVIVRLKTKEHQLSLQEKCKHFVSLKLPLDFKDLRGDVDFEDTQSVKKTGVLNVCLGFTIFERDFYTQTYRLYKETIYSDNIFHGDDLKIYKVCNTKVSIAGGQQITILIKLQSGYEYNVHLFRLNQSNNKIDWEQTLPVAAKDIFCNAALSVQLPKGPIVKDGDTCDVKLEVVVGNSSYKSQCVTISYHSNREGTAKIRKLQRLESVDELVTEKANLIYLSDFMSDFSDDIETSGQSYVVRLETIEERITHILHNQSPKKGNDLQITGFSKEYDNTIFHDAIMNESNFECLCRLMKSTQRRALVLKARNKFSHNLLHYACFRNKHQCIRPLVDMGCGLHEQDWQDRTPLHLVLELRHTDCILEFQDLLQNHFCNTEEVKANSIRMFWVYDHRGYTVLHMAALENLTDLLKIMLEFCKINKLDVTKYEVLGSGDSVVHLAVKRNFVHMIDLLKEYVPFYLTIQNYPGQTVLDIPDLPLEMFQALNAK